MKHNTIYFDQDGQRILHRHLQTGVAVGQRKKLHEGGAVFAVKASRDGSFVWWMDLSSPVEIRREEGLPTGYVAADMVIIRKAKKPVSSED